ncbi:TadE/TadG family type IV pilus assembly protein [Bradyrhizobium sp.]|uniref:TadE/TadG family type IV pilus assembly protein n=1 Tax=Bradyrhizobium sp. TaxID=376 RepID=UPI0039C87030
MRALLRMIESFARDSRGNIALTFGICSVPLLVAVGAGVDYSLATRMKAKLQSAADAAAVAAVSENGAGYLAATQMQSDGSVPAGVTDANNVFNGIMNTITGFTNLTVTPTVTKTGVNLQANVTFSAQVPTTFMNLAGFSEMTVTGSSAATATLPLYLDFYLTLDVSGSMGLPSTPAEAVRMQNVNPDNYRQYPTGCTLACHFAPQNSACTNSGTQGYPTNNYCLGYAISRVSQSGYQSTLINQSPQGTYPWKNPANNKYQQLPSSIVSGLPGSLTAPKSSGGAGLAAVTSCPTDGTDACIQLRLDAVGYAVNQMFALANQKEVITNQFRIGLYPFIRYLYQYFPLTYSINGSQSTPGTINYAAANLATLLDTNTNANLGSGGTHIDNGLSSINTIITNVGDGSTSTNTLPYVFLITDGAEDPQVKGVPNGSWSGSNHATTIDPTTVCTPLKNRGIKISVLYVPYVKINPVNASFANDEDDYANNNIPNIPGSLSACASPPDSSGSYFYTASTPQEINDSLQAMFNHALITAHLTN